MTAVAGAWASMELSVPAPRQPGMDPAGLSSLALLAAARPQPRMLLLESGAAAALHVGAGVDSRVVWLQVADWSRLPLASSSIHTVIVDLDAAPADEVSRSRIIAEVRRVLRTDGQVVALMSHRRRPRDRRDVRNYRLIPPAQRWRRLLRAERFTASDNAILRFDAARLVDIQLIREGEDQLPSRGDAAAVVIDSGSAHRPGSVVRQLVDRLEESTGHRTTLERVAVRKIGKTIAFLRTESSRGLVARIARSPIALIRARRNYDALLAIGGGASGTEALQLAPGAVLHQQVGAYEVFVEEWVQGAPRGPARAGELVWEPAALRFITELHRASTVRSVLGEPLYERLVGRCLMRIAPFLESAEQHRVLNRLSELLRQGLLGHELPLVRSHGDFTGENCLYDTQGRLCGVIDWELSSGESLPLLDLLQSMDLAGESNAHPRWQRADVVLDGVEQKGGLAAAPEIAQYVATLRIDPTLVPMLLLIYWVDHVSNRIEARASDRIWMERRVRQPLARIGGIVGSASMSRHR